MCGILGFLDIRKYLNAENYHKILSLMADTIKYRGPDAFGCWHDPNTGIGLAHQRLSIVDLSEAGSQPMHSNSKRYVIVFNGEIYNHKNLREELLSQHEIYFHGHSDTETLLACIDTWGLKKTLPRLSGMFAFALWDTHNQSLSLVRDRFGEKPLYYGFQNSGGCRCFLFGSDLGALTMHPAWQGEINRDALAMYLRHNYIGNKHSIYKNIFKVLPGEVVTLDKNGKVSSSIWWDSVKNIFAQQQNVFSGSIDDATHHLEILLQAAIKEQMIADVPLGAFLSGGIDSSLIVALMQSQSTHPVKTFTIGFNEAGFNEAEYAKDVARHLGTEHTELYVSSGEAMAVIPELPKIYTEPFADSSQIPTFLVSKLTREKVTVALSGDAGDELFCGYNRYILSSRFWSWLSKTPTFLKKIIAKSVHARNPESLNKFSGLMRIPTFGDKAHKVADLLLAADIKELYRGFVSHWPDPDSVVLGASESPSVLSNPRFDWTTLTPIEKMMALDTVSYLPDDILVKVDRAAMAVSLETRVPFLNTDVARFAWSLPIDFRLRNGISKWPLRTILRKYVPDSLIERPKMGFGVPLAQWLRGPLREWAEDLLSAHRLKQEGFFNAGIIQKKWSEHLRGDRNWHNYLWDILMFQSWLDHQRQA